MFVNCFKRVQWLTIVQYIINTFTKQAKTNSIRFPTSFDHGPKLTEDQQEVIHYLQFRLFDLR